MKAILPANRTPNISCPSRPTIRLLLTNSTHYEGLSPTPEVHRSIPTAHSCPTLHQPNPTTRKRAHEHSTELKTPDKKKSNPRPILVPQQEPPQRSQTTTIIAAVSPTRLPTITPPKINNKRTNPHSSPYSSPRSSRHSSGNNILPPPISNLHLQKKKPRLISDFFPVHSNRQGADPQHAHIDGPSYNQIEDGRAPTKATSPRAIKRPKRKPPPQPPPMTRMGSE